MHVEEMDKSEGGLVAIRQEPTARRAQYQGPIAPFSHREGIATQAAKEHGAGYRREGLKVKGTVVHIKSLVETHFPFEKDAADESCRLISVRPQHRRQRDGGRGNALCVLFNLVFEWVSRGE